MITLLYDSILYLVLRQTTVFFTWIYVPNKLEYAQPEVTVDIIMFYPF